jgi:hypothetical protein
MCRLKDFWWVIFPEPVTLNLFFALEFVLTFGITVIFIFTPCWRSAPAETYGALWAISHPKGVIETGGKAMIKISNFSAIC